jgi:hypothetical protein
MIKKIFRLLPQKIQFALHNLIFENATAEENR